MYTVTVTLHGNTRVFRGLSEAAAKRILTDCGFKKDAHVTITKDVSHV